MTLPCPMPRPAPGALLRPMLVRPSWTRLRERRFEAEALPWRGEIYRAALAALRNRDEAEELTQDVFFQAWRSFDRFAEGTNCRAWLRGILFHRLLHHRRRAARLVFGERAEAAIERLEAPRTHHDGLLSPALARALAELPAPFRAVLLLADVHEFAYKEIAARLGIPAGTVMSRLSRARRRMRALLEDQVTRTPSCRQRA